MFRDEENLLVGFQTVNISIHVHFDCIVVCIFLTPSSFIISSLSSSSWSLYFSLIFFSLFCNYKRDTLEQQISKYQLLNVSIKSNWHYQTLFSLIDHFIRHLSITAKDHWVFPQNSQNSTWDSTPRWHDEIVLWSPYSPLTLSSFIIKPLSYLLASLQWLLGGASSTLCSLIGCRSTGWQLSLLLDITIFLFLLLLLLILSNNKSHPGIKLDTRPHILQPKFQDYL